MTKQTVKLGFGKVTLRTSTATYAPMRLRPPFLRDSAVTTAVRNPRTQINTPVSAFPQINGAMSCDDCTHENGTIIMLQASRTRGTMRLADAAVILRLREQAALLNVIGILPHGPESTIGDRFSLFLGRADILSPEEAAVFQITVPGNFQRNYFSLDEINEMFDVHEIQPEIAPRPDVALVSTSSGVVIKEMAQVPARRMKFRK